LGSTGRDWPNRHEAHYRPLLAATLLCYALLTQSVKMLLLRFQWI
jgi:hypothetical protein